MAPRSLCLTTAFTPALTFLGGSCPLGCSLSALPQGDSLWLAPSAHVCGRLLGGDAGRWPTSWGYHSTIVRILQGGWGITWGGALLWRAPSFSGGSGLACAVVPPAHPPTFLETGGLPLYPRRGLRPLHPAGGPRVLLWSMPSFSGGSGLACAVVPPAHPPTFLETGGLPLYPRRGLRPLHPAGGPRVLLWSMPSFSGGSGLACAVVPPAHPPTFLETGGLPLYPRRGLRPLHPAGGPRVLLWSMPSFSGGSVLACAAIPPAPLGVSGPLS